MIDTAGVSRLLETRAPGNGILSVYLNVPLDPGQRRGMPAHLDELLARSDRAGSGNVGEDGVLASAAGSTARRSEVPAIRQQVSAHAPDWLGRGVAIFASTELGMLDTIPLRGQVRERAVIGSRPYVRPLLAELQRCPSYAVAVIDRRHAWLFRVSGDGITPEGHLESQTVGSRRFGGWHGFQSYRNHQRARTLARQHYAAGAAALASAVASGGCGPVVVGGHEALTREFLASLPAGLRGRVAGTFVIDPHTMTPARVRQLADLVVARWEDDRERELAAEVAGDGPASMTAIGLTACLAAANQHAIQLLMVQDDAVQPGFSCERCGSLAVAGGACQTCSAPTWRVGDVIEELAVKVTRDGGSVRPVRDSGVLADVAAKRRFPASATPG